MQELTNTELAVMEALWERDDGATVRDVVLSVYGRHEHSLHGAVKSYLDRLMKKGFVKVDKHQFAHRFSAVVTRQRYVGAQLKRLADSHFGGSLAPVLTSLVQEVKLSRKDRAAIEQIIDNIRD